MAGTSPATASNASKDKITPIEKVKPASFEDGDYIVLLKQPAAASYTGGTNGFAATRSASGEFNARSTAATQYRGYLRTQHRSLARSVGAKIASQYTIASNGFSATLTGTQASQLSKDSSVMAVVPNDKRELLDYDSDNTAKFLDMVGRKGAWNQNGGKSDAGDGVVVGVIDTGIWPESESFQGAALTAAASGSWGAHIDPLGNTTMRKADGGTFNGRCETGEDFELSDCSTKIIGARYYPDTFQAYVDAGYIVPNEAEFSSPRDGGGHGSHTASTAAGDSVKGVSVEGVDFGEVVGMAPAASIAAYKVCWEATTPGGADASGCYGDALLSAIDDAVRDGVDVINYSIGGAPTDTLDPVEVAFAGAADAGVFVAASAGNSGPTASSVDHHSPWLTTVAASTYRNFDGTVVLGDGTELLGVSSSTTGVSGSLVASTDVGLDGQSEQAVAECWDGSLDPEKVAADDIVVCDRGTVARVEKSATVLAAGGAGMLLMNTSANSLDADFHSVPTVHLQDTDYNAVYDYLADAGDGATAEIIPGNQTDLESPAVPVISGFSSRGPALANNMDILKPDIAAPGSNVLAAVAPPSNSDRDYDLYSGTSMSSPHIAGLGAFIMGEHPNWSPMAVKSAMMTTAQNTKNDDGSANRDVFAQGSGEVTPTSMFSPGLFVTSTPRQWYGLLTANGYDTGVRAIDAKRVNLPSMADSTVLQSTTFVRWISAQTAGTWKVKSAIKGFDVDVNRSVFKTKRGQKRKLVLTFTPNADATYGEWAQGYVNVVGRTKLGRKVVRMPVALKPLEVDAPASVEGTGTDGSVDVTVTGGVNDEIPLTMEGLAGADTVSGAVAPNDYDGYCVPVAEGSSLIRFDLDALDDTADLDLSVYAAPEADCSTGYGSLVGSSATASADESVTVEAPDSPAYVVFIDGYSAGDLGSPMDYDLNVYDVNPASSEGAVTFTPSTLSLSPREETTFTTEWSGLDADSQYLGFIRYGDTGVSTMLTVTTPAVP
ncbi:S8 family serine peptidase [Nocardioides bruguierae]|uniref:S8 family serine peptidase n=1 Tax=Nocardioides bruguierae TaxID=2945102 RepID=A0A9X2IEF9_9ACTN|nr:S8 family serine peptidase [Nocardioides bruguierae]MCM0620257.1 S8 family serine peptidase [Nocardioides bruguierae]